VDGITAIINGFGLAASDAEDVADSLFTAVRNGKTTFDQIAGSIGRVAANANAVGVNFEETNAAITVLTLSLGNTSQSVDSLRGIFAAFSRNQEEFNEIFEDVGGIFAALRDPAFTLADVFKRIGEAVPANEFLTLFGRVEAMNAAQILTVESAKALNFQLEEQAKRAGSSSAAFEIIAATLDRRLKIATVGVQTAFIEFGASAAPVTELLIKLLEETADLLEGLARGNFFEDFLPPATVDSAKTLLAIFFEIVEQVILLVGDLLGVTGELGTAIQFGDILKILFLGIGTSIALIRDAITGLRLAIAFVGRFLIDFLQAPLDGILATVAVIVDIFNEDLALSIKNVGSGLARTRKGLDEFINSQQNILTEGATASFISGVVDAESTVRDFSKTVDTTSDENDKNIDDTTDKVSKLEKQLKLAGQAFAKSASAAATLLRTQTNIELERLNFQLEQGIINFEEFLGAKRLLSIATIDAQLLALNDSIKNATGRQELARFEAERRGLLLQRKAIEEDINRERIRAAKETVDLLADLRQELAEGTSPTALSFEDIRANVARGLEETRRELERAGEDTQIIDALIDQRAVTETLDQLEDQVSASRARIQTQIRLVEARQAAGDIGREEARQRIINLEQEEANVLRDVGEVLQANALLVADPRALQIIRDLEVEIIALETVTNRFLDSFRENLESGLGDFLFDLTTSAKTFKEAFADLTKSVLDNIARMASDAASAQIIESLFTGSGGAGGEGGFGGLLSNLFGGGGFAEGGQVEGAGTGTSDSIAARLSAGEYVMRTKAVEHYGPHLMEALNRMALTKSSLSELFNITSPRTPHFQAGGFVDGGVQRGNTVGDSVITVQNTFNVRGGGELSERSKEQITSEVARSIDRSKRRSN